jgi:SnoaL-like domain
MSTDASNVQPAAESDDAAVRNVLARFALLADEGEISQIAGLFASDGVWQAGETVFSGRQAIAAGIASMRGAGHVGPQSGMRHLLGAAVVAFPQPGVAVARCYWLLIATLEELSMAAMGEFRVDLRKQLERWRIARHEAFVLAM